MIDTSRHFISIPVLQNTINGLMYSKINILHLHLTDDESFTFDSQYYPQLCYSASFKGKN